MTQDPKQVAVIGLWHQGVVAAACLTEWGYDVIAADYDTARIGNLQAGKAPLFEPGLDELLARGIASGGLRFTSKPAEAVDGRPFVLLMHDTPVNENDESDLTEILRTVAAFRPPWRTASRCMSRPRSRSEIRRTDARRPSRAAEP